MKKYRWIIIGILVPITIALLHSPYSKDIISLFLKEQHPVSIVYTDSNIEFVRMAPQTTDWVIQNKNMMEDYFYQLDSEDRKIDNACELSGTYSDKMPGSFVFWIEFTLYNNSKKDLFINEFKVALVNNNHTESVRAFQSIVPFVIEKNNTHKVTAMIEYSRKYDYMNNDFKNSHSSLMKISGENELSPIKTGHQLFFNLLLKTHQKCYGGSPLDFSFIDQNRGVHKINLLPPPQFGLGTIYLKTE